MNHFVLFCSMLFGAFPPSSKNISVSINRNADDVYAFIASPENLPQWAAGLGDKVQRTSKENVWLVNTPGGPASVRFTEKNKFRVVDHYVTIGTKPEVYIPLRVLAHGNGSEVVFTLFRLPDMTDEEFTRDMNAVQKDLNTIKEILEK